FVAWFHASEPDPARPRLTCSPRRGGRSKPSGLAGHCRGLLILAQNWTLELAVTLYDAFISYSHSRDKPIASALQSAIQRLGKPWYRRRVLRVFRDDTSLSATPGLWPAIEQALARSRFLILLASPQAAASPWVAKEVSYWLEHKGAETLLIGVTDG